MTSQLLSIIFPDGNPNGVRKIEIPLATIKCFVIPRAFLSSLSNEALLKKHCFYVLQGEGESESRPKVYIGESENAWNRLTDHDANKEFWNTAFVFVAEDVHKGTIRYAEQQAVTEARAVDRFEVLNTVQPSEKEIGDFEKIKATQFIEAVKFVLGFLGLQIFAPIPKTSKSKNLYYFKTNRAIATGTLLESGEFVVYKDSTARIHESEAFAKHKYAPVLRKKLVEEGILKETDDNSYIFTDDYVFNSPSAAGNAVAGRATDGWIVWVDEDGKSLDENVRK